MLLCNISKNYTSFGFGDETLLIVTFKPIDQLNLKNCPSVYKASLIGIVSIAIYSWYARVRIFNVLSHVRLTEGTVCTVA